MNLSGRPWIGTLAGAPCGAVRVTDLQIRPYALALRRPWVSARGATGVRRGWLLRLDTDRGLRGWGDCAPWPAAGTVSPRVAGMQLAWLAGRSAGVPLGRWLQRVAGLSGPVRFACEAAALDVLGQLLHRPLRRLLIPRAPDAVPVNAALGPLDRAIGRRLDAAAERGFRVVKIKLGMRPAAVELAALARLIPGLGGVALRLDVNGAWSLREARRALARCGRWPLEAVEAPCAGMALPELARWQHAVSYPLALDEEVRRAAAVAGAVRRWILKPTVHGLGGVVELAERARRAGVQVVLTSTLESAVGLMAVAQAAAALGTANVAQGLGTADWLAADTAAFPQTRDGVLRLPGEPGLGVHPAAEGAGGNAV